MKKTKKYVDKIKRKSNEEISNIASVDELVKTSSNNFLSSRRALQCGAVFSCVGLLAESIAQLPLKFYVTNGDNKLEDRQHYIYNLLARRPCSWLNSFAWRELAMMLLCLRGDFYAYKVRDNQGRVKELLPLMPGSISVRQLPNWELEYRIYLSNGEYKTVTENEIFHVMYRSLDGIKGLSPIAFSRQAINLSIAVEEHGYKTFTNGAKPGGVLKIPTAISKEAYQRLKENWQSAYSGDNAGTTAILEQGVDFSPVSMTNSDAQYLETMRFQVEQIARIFRVPLFMIQSTEKNTSWGSGIEQMALGFVRFTLLPWIKRWEDAIYKDLISEFDTNNKYFVKFNVEGLERGSISARATAYQQFVNMGVYSPNDIRKLEDMNPREGGDIYLTPLNMRINEEDDEKYNEE